MANPEHLEQLNLGAQDWNQWRLDHREITPDLEQAILNGKDLSYYVLTEANLKRAQLRGANLVGAALHGANLYNADLVRANFSFSQLDQANIQWTASNGVNFQQANLWKADLSSSDLTNTNFTWATLYETNFGDAQLGGTTFGHNDLSTIKGTETVRHLSLSAIGIGTLYISHGNIPEAFLRGCGVPENFIAFSKSLVNKPIEFYSCFISYSHQDKSFARRLHDQLQARGIRCWLDDHQMLPGHDIYEEVDRGIKLWDKLLLCASEHSLTSWWVDSEINKAFAKEQQLMKERGTKTLSLIPLNLDGYLFDWKDGKADEVKRRLATDFTGWETDNVKFEQEFERIVKALRTDGGREEPPASKL